MSELVGQNLGKYRIVARLGQGGMAEVYKAYQPGLDRHVAIKIMLGHVAKEAGSAERFEKEAVAVARLHHPNIVQVYDFDVQSSLYYMVMEFIEGPTLRAELEERARKNQTFDLKEIVPIFNALTNAVDYAHGQGIIHHDLKPDNVMITPIGQLVLTDFGIAQMVGGTCDLSTGTISGTPAYIAPEQAQGEFNARQSDIYSLGVILYELVTGRVPFVGQTPVAVIMMHLTEPAPPPSTHNPELPQAVEQVILKALAKEPEQRYQRAAELRRALWEAIGLSQEQLAAVPMIAALAATPQIQEVALTPDRPPLSPSEPPPPCPYRGLFAFREEDAPFFFGREAFVAQLLEAVRQRAMVAVLGPSGSGKSSVVFAGLLPRLRNETDKWYVVSFRPGNQPFHAMAEALLTQVQPEINQITGGLGAQVNAVAEALRRGERSLSEIIAEFLDQDLGTSQVLMVIDQFEELYTLCPEGETRRRFADQLLAAVEVEQGYDPHQQPVGFTLVLTMRADFLGQALAHRPFADALQAADVKLGPMTPQELDRTIENPAGRQGVLFETGLAARILDDVGEEPGNLPLLEFALTLLWDRQVGGLLTHAAYEEIGRVEGALAHYADEVYAGLSPAQQLQARRLFIQLVRPGEGTEDTRRRASRSELGEASWTLARRLADARLVVTGRDSRGEETGELVHEALIRGWSKLRGWMEADRSFRAWQERLRLAARQWQASGQDDGALLRGSLLAEAEAWLAERPGDLSQADCAFIQASVDLRRQKQMVQERQRRRVMGGLVAGLTLTVLGLVVVLILAAVAGLGWRRAGLEADRAAEQRQLAEKQAAEAEAQRATAEASALEAEHQRTRAEEQRQAALSRQLMAQSLNYAATQPDLALLLSLEAGRIAETNHQGFYHTLLTALETNPHLATYQREHILSVRTVAFSPDGKILASAGDDEMIFLEEVETGQSASPPLIGHTEPINSIAFHPDGTMLASADDEGRIILWDLQTHRPRNRQPAGHNGWVNHIVFSPDGNILASAGGNDNAIMLWDAETGRLRTQLTGHDDEVRMVAFSPASSTLASASYDGAIILWNIDTGQPLGAPLIGHTDAVMSVAFSPDGRLLASGGRDNLVLLWDLTRRPYQRFGRPLLGHTNTVLSLAFSPDGQMLASGGWDKIISVWDVATQQPAGPSLTGHTDTINSLAFHPNGRHLASGSADRTVILWDLATRQRLAHPLDKQSAAVFDLAFSPDGDKLASASADYTVLMWDVRRRQAQELALAAHSNWVHGVAFSPDGQILASGSDDQTIILWDAGRNVQLGSPLAGHTGGVLGLAFSPDGNILASGSADTTIILWDVERRRPVRQLSGHSDRVWSVSFSPDGQTLASAGDDNTIILWDTASGEPVSAPLSGHTHPIYSIAFSPDGQILASGSVDGTIILWDVSDRTSPVTLDAPLVGHTDTVLSVAFSPDGQLLASSSWDKSIILWDVATRQPSGSPLTGHTGQVNVVTFSPNGQMLASGDTDGLIRLWDVPSRQPLGQPLTGHQRQILSQALSPDGAVLATGSTDGPISLWDVENGQRLAQLNGHSDWVKGLAFSPDGQWLASASNDATIILWDAQQGEMVDQLTAHSDSVFDVVFSPDGQMLASADSENIIILWDVEEAEVMHRITTRHNDGINELAFSPDGQLLAAASNDDTISLWEVDQGRSPCPALTGHTSEVYSVDFSPDGKLLASASADTGVRLWEVETCQGRSQPLARHTSWVSRVLFSPDGQILVSAGADKQIILWDTASWQPLGSPLVGHTAEVQNLSFSSDGKTLVSSGYDGAIVRWDINPSSWQTLACQVTRRNLTWAEWQRYLPDQPYHCPCSEQALQLRALMQQADSYAQAGQRELAEPAFGRAVQAALETGAAIVNNNLCWNGSLNRYAEIVLPACEKAVDLATDDELGLYRDSRGLARALSGDYAGAIEDFEFFMDWSRKHGGYHQLRLKRHAWIRALEEGQNPFDAATLEQLRLEE